MSFDFLTLVIIHVHRAASSLEFHLINFKKSSFKFINLLRYIAAFYSCAFVK